MLLLLDTNVVCELRKVRAGNADPNVARWANSLDTADLFLPAITIHALEIGVLLAERRDPPQEAIFRQWLERRVLPTCDGPVLPMDAAAARRAAQLHVPDPRPINDAFIAATALVHGVTVATRNLAGFVAMGVTPVNPWA